MQDRHLVLTPEKVIVSYDLGSVGSRVGAHFIDLMIFLVLTISASMFIQVGFVWAPALGESVGLLIGAFGYFLYHILCEGLLQGTTLGKKAFRLRVMNVDGTPITMREALLRNLLRPADMLPGLYLAGLIMLFVTPQSQRIGDLVAGTIVVKEPLRQQGYTPAPHHVGLHPLEHTVGDLTGMNLEEYHAIKRLCDRFPYLTLAEQNESIETIWKPFAEREKIPPLSGSHPIYQMEAVVMKFGRMKNLV